MKKKGDGMDYITLNCKEPQGESSTEGPGQSGQRVDIQTHVGLKLNCLQSSCVEGLVSAWWWCWEVVEPVGGGASWEEGRSLWVWH
jgi:hypothetical protein